MQVIIEHEDRSYSVDLKNPIDISYPLVPGAETPKCFWAPNVEAEPVRAHGFVGSTQEGGVVNFYDVKINPHGNGTHTECVGHIAKVQHSVQECFDQFHFISKLITITPKRVDNGDQVITEEQIISALSGDEKYDALIIRTLPNSLEAKKIDYSESNPPYVHVDCMSHINKKGIRHLLIDLPSVDRESDDGALAAHHAYWQYPEVLHDKKTITELVYIDNVHRDGIYLLEMQVAPLVLDASPSRPVIYPLKKQVIQ